MDNIRNNILTVNTGSSSLKLAVFNKNNHNEPVLRIQMDSIGSQSSSCTWSRFSNDKTIENGGGKFALPSHSEALHLGLKWIDDMLGSGTIIAVGYRVVHGGPYRRNIEVIDKVVFEELKKFAQYDPDHLPETIKIISKINRHYPLAKHIACYDSCFFVNLPYYSKRLALPRTFDSIGVERYGFHGLSYMYLRATLKNKKRGDIAKKKVVMAHLGSGSSLAAMKNGLPIDTTMSFSPTSGIMTSTRSGDIDPSLMYYLNKRGGINLSLLNDILNKESGLKGVSGVTGDMYSLLQIKDNNIQAKQAIDMYCYQVTKTIGAYSAAMGGIDALVFSGGIGEKSAPIRRQICKNLKFLGIKLDEKSNDKNKEIISKRGSKVKIYTFVTDESQVIANMVRSKLGLLNKG